MSGRKGGLGRFGGVVGRGDSGADAVVRRRPTSHFCILAKPARNFEKSTRRCVSVQVNLSK